MTPLPYPVDGDESEETTDVEVERFLESRSIGLRVPVAFGVFVTSGTERVRARAAELSTTGIVLDFRHSPECAIEGLVTLDLALPGLSRPIRTAARPVRSIFGRLQAFEFMIIGRDERLSIAEFLDRVRSSKG